MFSEGLQEFLSDDLLPGHQISEEAERVIEKVFHGEELSEQELDLLLTPNESAALLSAKYRRKIKRRYIKDLGRAVPSKTTDNITPARLAPDRVISKTHLYRVGRILAVPMRGPAAADGKGVRESVNEI